MFLARATTHRSSSVLQLNGIRCPVFRLKLKLNPKPKPLGENLQWRPLSIYGRQRSVDIDTNKLPHNVKSQDFDPSHQGEKPVSLYLWLEAVGAVLCSMGHNISIYILAETCRVTGA